VEEENQIDNIEDFDKPIEDFDKPHFLVDSL
jgi:hypothetical protein